MAVLTNEILTVYPLLNPSQLTAAASNRVCNALALLQCVASHNETRQLFLNGEPKNASQVPHLIITSSSPALPVPVPEYHLQIAPVRVPSPYFARRDRCAG